MGVQDVSLVVDFETLGVSRDSIVLSGAAICFQGDKVRWNMYGEFDIPYQILEGSQIDKHTVDWWKQTDLVEFERLLLDPDPRGLHSVDLWVSDVIGRVRSDGYKLKEFWSRDHMDFEIFNYHLSSPLEYYVFRDIRTLDSLKLAKMKPNDHHAMKDCENELEYLQEVLKICQGLKQQENGEESESDIVGIPLVFPSSK
jgi:hypothetical protein